MRVVSVLPPPQNTRQGADQLISENDLLEVDVFQVDDLDRTVRVDSNGRITMPLIGAIQAAGQNHSGSRAGTGTYLWGQIPAIARNYCVHERILRPADDTGRAV